MTANPLPINQTLTFVTTYLNAGKKVLEVGGGTGALAKALGGLGFDVVMLDSSEQAVQTAKASGVRAVHADWPDYRGGPFDAILFTRSLHHISPLGKALDQSKNLLKPKGLLIVEDFAFDEVDAATQTWFYLQLQLMTASGVRFLEKESFGHRVLAQKGAPEVWHQDHDHDLHSAEIMASAIKERFSLEHHERAPYLYRYLCDMLPDHTESQTVLQAFLESEKALALLYPQGLIGRRWVARV